MLVLSAGFLPVAAADPELPALAPIYSMSTGCRSGGFIWDLYWAVCKFFLAVCIAGTGDPETCDKLVLH